MLYLPGNRTLSVILAILATKGAGAQEWTRRVSVASTGVEGNAASGGDGAQFTCGPWLSADARYVAFSSRANNLVPNDQNNFIDVFVHDRVTGTTERVSTDANGVEANRASGLFEHDASLSWDGSLVVFGSDATNLIPPSAPNFRHIYIRARTGGQVGIVDRGMANAEASGSAFHSRIAADGRSVVFASGARNLVPNDNNNTVDVFVCHLQAGMIERVSVSSAGAEARNGGQFPSISADGRQVAFASSSGDLVPNDTNQFSDVFVRDLVLGQTTRVSVTSSGAQTSIGHSEYPWISGDGRFVTFLSQANDLVAGDTNNLPDVFVHDRQTARTWRVSVDSTGVQGNRESYGLPVISGDGRIVAFTSNAQLLAAGDTNARGDLFLHDLATGITTRASVNSDGGQAAAPFGAVGQLPHLAWDGSLVAFHGDAIDLVANDTNNVTDVFVRYHVPATCLLRGLPRIHQAALIDLDARFDANNIYVAACSFGSRPGLSIDSRALPLNPDLLFVLSLQVPAVFARFVGQLDANGRATASLAVPPELLGIPFYAAFLTLRGGAPTGVGAISNEVLLVPLR